MEYILKKTSIVKRIVAYCIDKFIIFSFWFLFIFSFDSTNLMYGSAKKLGAFLAWLEFSHSRSQYSGVDNECTWFMIIFVIINILYYLIFESSGTTLGKSMLNISIRDSNGQIRFLKSVVRQISFLILFFVLYGICVITDIPHYFIIILSYLIIYTPMFYKRQSLIDIISDVHVLDNKIKKI
jgi:hypothetical protein